MFIAFLDNFLALSHVTATIFLLFLVGYLSWKYFQVYNLPPGPWGVPVFGYLPFLRKHALEETFTQLSKKYGNVFSLFLGHELIVVLNSYDAIIEAFDKQADNFAGRPQGLFFKIRETDKGVSHLDGEPWKEHRRFIQTAILEYGTGIQSLEHALVEEVDCFLKKLGEQKGEPFDITKVLGMSAANIICTLQFGRRFDYNDERFILLLRLRDEILDVFPRIPNRAFLPWLKYLPYTEAFTHQEEVNQAQDNLENFVMDLAQEHMAEYEENSRKNLIDAYFTERNTFVRATGDEGNFGVHELKGTLVALYGAGTETVTSTLRWAFLCMMLYPEIQLKVQEEIVKVIGAGKRPSTEDKSQMPYTEAVLMETQRFGSITPLGLPHSNLEETELSGYRIPKRTNIIPNFWAIHHDPKLWKNPNRFYPERFINQEGKIEKPEFFIPFGIGKRSCLGESLANMELFLYFTSCLQCFDIQPPAGTKPTMDIESTFVRRPRPFQLRAIQREGYKR